MLSMYRGHSGQADIRAAFPLKPGTRWFQGGQSTRREARVAFTRTAGSGRALNNLKDPHHVYVPFPPPQIPHLPP